MVQLRNGAQATDPRLGRIPQPDPRNLNFPVRTLFSAPADEVPLRGYTWQVPVNLDQGQEGACVGFAFSQELAARPAVVSGVTNDTAHALYWEIQRNDDWPGGAYPGADPQYDGTSTLAGAKTLAAAGYYKEYRWATSERELAVAVGYTGPAVIGINWYDDMFSPDENGVLHVSGNVAGGHCILVSGFSPQRGLYKLWNSWGSSWGKGGAAYISRGDMARLILEQGDVCIPVRNKKMKTFLPIAQ